MSNFGRRRQSNGLLIAKFEGGTVEVSHSRLLYIESGGNRRNDFLILIEEPADGRRSRTPLLRIFANFYFGYLFAGVLC